MPFLPEYCIFIGGLIVLVGIIAILLIIRDSNAAAAVTLENAAAMAPEEISAACLTRVLNQQSVQIALSADTSMPKHDPPKIPLIENNQKIGRIHKFSKSEGHGEIIFDEDSDLIVFQVEDCKVSNIDDLKKDTQVICKIIQSDNGKRAIDVQIINKIW